MLFLYYFIVVIPYDQFVNLNKKETSMCGCTIIVYIQNIVIPASGRRVVPSSHALIRVSGQYAREARGVEIRDEDQGENRGACYLLREGGKTWVWCATTATGDEREVAKNMAYTEPILVMQGILYKYYLPVPGLYCQ